MIIHLEKKKERKQSKAKIKIKKKSNQINQMNWIELCAHLQIIWNYNEEKKNRLICLYLLRVWVHLSYQKATHSDRSYPADMRTRIISMTLRRRTLHGCISKLHSVSKSLLLCSRFDLNKFHKNTIEVSAFI